MESAALIRAMRAGVLDRLEIPHCPMDVLMQQIVAACAAEAWEEDALYEVLRRAHPYQCLRRKDYDEILCLLADGIEASRGRYGSYLLRDRVNGRMQSRRGARTIAVSNGGTIPDTALYSVIVQPEGVQIATLDEDFAVETSAGDVILLGNTSWRVQRVESAGRVLVEANRPMCRSGVERLRKGRSSSQASSPACGRKLARERGMCSRDTSANHILRWQRLWPG
jgi:ATP-dependent helicase Lhr and Lhr-like helicase